MPQFVKISLWQVNSVLIHVVDIYIFNLDQLYWFLYKLIPSPSDHTSDLGIRKRFILYICIGKSKYLLTEQGTFG